MRRFEDFGYSILGTEKIKIKAVNGKYVSTDYNRKMMLVANRDSAKGWETFMLIHLDKNRCVLKAWNDCYILTLDRGEQQAAMDIIDKYEVFDFIDLGNNKFALKSANGKYLGTEYEEPFFIYAHSPEINDRTTFLKENQFDSELICFYNSGTPSVIAA